MIVTLESGEPVVQPVEGRMMQPGLSRVASDLVTTLESRDDQGRRRAAIAAACYALETNDLMDN